MDFERARRARISCNSPGSARRAARLFDMSDVRLSVATPCFNEAESIESVVATWDAVLSGAPFASEIVLCNDGSTDGTAAVLEKLKQRFPRLRVVTLERNAGYGRALSSAINASIGQYIATIDSDGQFDLSEALLLLADLEAGKHDCVTG